MTPLIDVMLVLLIVFMVTAPFLRHSVRIDLPKASSQPVRTTPRDIRLGIRESGEYLWNGETVSDVKLEALMKDAAAQEPQPELHIHADAKTAYQAIAQAMAMASRSGVSKIGFMSDPDRHLPR